MRVTLLLLTALLIAACVTETRSPYGDSARDRSSGGEDRGRESRGDPGETVSLPHDVLKAIEEFVNRSHFLIADRIEVDATRIPFQAEMVLVNDNRYVETVELGNVRQKAMGFLLRARSQRPLLERERPRIRFGDGMELVAMREIQVRTYNAVDPERPVYIRIQGVGHAVYRDEESGRRIEKDAIAIRGEVVPGRDGLVFRQVIL